jgi:hypothetical protein
VVTVGERVRSFPSGASSRPLGSREKTVEKDGEDELGLGTLRQPRTLKDLQVQAPARQAAALWSR